nr:hypothetical protein BEI47_19955 [Aliivibrio fischeri]
MINRNQQKKQKELFYATEAARFLKQDWIIIEKEDEENYPDLVIEQRDTTFGLEVTQYFRDYGLHRKGSVSKTKESRNLSKLLNLASDYYMISNIPVMIYFNGSLFKDNFVPKKLADLANALNPKEQVEYVFQSGLKVYIQRLTEGFGEYKKWQLVNDRGGVVRRISKKNFKKSFNLKQKS